MSNINEKGYGVCRSIDDAKHIATTAQKGGLRGCYPAAAVVLASALAERDAEIAELERLSQRKPFNYIAEAAVTRSDQWHGNKVSFVMLRRVLADCVEALENLDAIKKTLFYGRELPEHLQLNCGPADALENCHSLPGWFKDDKFGEYVIHAIIGAATEAGELVQALRATVVEGKAFDEVNMREEVGDGFWYFAILADVCGFTFDEAQHVNIAKLRARYPNKFTTFDANNRNLSLERSILEGGNKVSPCIGHAVASAETEEEISS